MKNKLRFTAGFLACATLIATHIAALVSGAAIVISQNQKKLAQTDTAK